MNMKTGNGYSPNPMGRFKGTMKKETSNVVRDSNGAKFTAKKSVIARKGGTHNVKK